MVYVIIACTIKGNPTLNFQAEEVENNQIANTVDVNRQETTNAAKG
jgi:hypothetical protein